MTKCKGNRTEYFNKTPFRWQIQMPPKINMYNPRPETPVLCDKKANPLPFWKLASRFAKRVRLFECIERIGGVVSPRSERNGVGVGRKIVRKCAKASPYSGFLFAGASISPTQVVSNKTGGCKSIATERHTGHISHQNLRDSRPRRQEAIDKNLLALYSPSFQDPRELLKSPCVYIRGMFCQLTDPVTLTAYVPGT